jgi:hypothetical protein
VKTGSKQVEFRIGRKMALPHDIYLKYFLISSRPASSARACSMV